MILEAIVEGLTYKLGIGLSIIIFRLLCTGEINGLPLFQNG